MSRDLLLNRRFSSKTSNNKNEIFARQTELNQSQVSQQFNVKEVQQKFGNFFLLSLNKVNLVEIAQR